MQALFWVLRLLKAASDAGMHLMQRCIKKMPVRCKKFCSLVNALSVMDTDVEVKSKSAQPNATKW